jgi:hypothetical protein
LRLGRVLSSLRDWCRLRRNSLSGYRLNRNGLSIYGPLRRCRLRRCLLWCCLSDSVLLELDHLLLRGECGGSRLSGDRLLSRIGGRTIGDDTNLRLLSGNLLNGNHLDLWRRELLLLLIRRLRLIDSSRYRGLTDRLRWRQHWLIVLSECRRMHPL